MTIKQRLRQAEQILKIAKITSANLDAEVILCFVLKKSKEWLYAHLNDQLTKQPTRRFIALIKKRATHYPTAYIINKREFYGLDFFVNKNVLVPRPESELLVEKANEIIAAQPQNQLVTIADIGTGSGCLAIALAKQNQNRKNLQIIATDISPAALASAKKNARQHCVSSRIKFSCGDLLTPIKNKKIDLIVANLPYLPNKKICHQSSSQSLKFEPPIALFSRQNGLRHYRRLIQQISRGKFPPRWILIEMLPQQTQPLRTIIKKYLPAAQILMIKDLAKMNRVFVVYIN